METLKVLVVDDEMGMRLGVDRVLSSHVVDIQDINKKCDFQLSLAETGEIGLEMVMKDSPDILLLDHKLPGMSGLDVLQAIPEETRDDMLIIMITAYATIEAAVTATKQGAYDFLAKPFTPAELRSTIRKAATRLMLARHAKRLEEEKRQVRFEFIRVLGHELKSPLGAVEGYLNLLSDKTLGSNLDDYEHMIERSSARLQQMRRLITDLLDMTRIDSGQKKRELTDLDVCEAARRAMESLQIDAEARGITLQIHGPETLTMKADLTELEIIFNNLVSNAVKYNRDNGRVDLYLEQHDEMVTIRCTDTGIGMNKDDVAKLFGEFTRIRNRKTKNIMGTGLGLSILKRIINLYNGDVSVTSEEDVGTTFTVHLEMS